MSRTIAAWALSALLMVPFASAQEPATPDPLETLEEMRSEWENFRALTDEEKAEYLRTRIEETVVRTLDQIPETQRAELLEDLETLRQLNELDPQQRLLEVQRLQLERLEETIESLPPEQAEQIRNWVREFEGLMVMGTEERQAYLRGLVRNRIENAYGNLEPGVRIPLEQVIERVETLQAMNPEMHPTRRSRFLPLPTSCFTSRPPGSGSVAARRGTTRPAHRSSSRSSRGVRSAMFSSGTPIVIASPTWAMSSSSRPPRSPRVPIGTGAIASSRWMDPDSGM